jgi:4-diphosphocytidyl-2-C-methyl-D-erythritol kinase
MRSLLLELGSDCPFFIDSVPSCASGRGEILHQVENFLAGYHILMVNPGIHISTREAYANCHPKVPESSLESLIKLPVGEWQGKILNDFEEYAFGLYPLIGSIRNILYDSGALFSSMSGSGSTVYGIFHGPPRVPDSIRDYIIYSGISE